MALLAAFDFLQYSRHKKLPPYLKFTFVVINPQVLSWLQGHAIKQPCFQRSWNEWMFSKQSEASLAQIFPLECPACFFNPLDFHYDGNMKLYRWDRDYEGWRSEYNNDFILKSEQVMEHLAHLDLATGNRHPNVS
jgi:hypothetical protein